MTAPLSEWQQFRAKKACPILVPEDERSAWLERPWISSRRQLAQASEWRWAGADPHIEVISIHSDSESFWITWLRIPDGFTLSTRPDKLYRSRLLKSAYQARLAVDEIIYGKGG